MLNIGRITAPLGEIIKKGRKIKREGGRDGGGGGEGDSMHLCLQESCICYLELFKNK